MDRRNTRPRLLITGGSGLLALGWATTFRERADVLLATHRHRVTLRGIQAIPVDLTSHERLTETLLHLSPTVVIHAAGLTSVDTCQQLPQQAREINIDMAAGVAQATRDASIPLIHISTDHLFTGDRSYASETDTEQPLNVYAETKLEAERRVLTEAPHAMIVRTNFFGWGSAIRRSFSDWILDSLRDNRPITLFDDAFFTPILIADLAEAAMGLILAGTHGIVNVVGDERISKFDFGIRLARRFGLSEAGIQRGKIAAFHNHAPRPPDMSLSNAKATRILGRPLGGLDTFFNRLAYQEASGLAQEIYNAVTE